jgi:hypothetical protein
VQNFENFKTDGKFLIFLSTSLCSLYGREQSFSWSIIYLYCCFATVRLNVRTNTLSNTVILSRRTCCCLLDPAGAEFCLTACHAQVQTRSKTDSGLKMSKTKQSHFYFKIICSVIAACLIIFLTIQPVNFRKSALSGGSPAQNFGNFKTDGKIFRFFSTLINLWH